MTLYGVRKSEQVHYTINAVLKADSNNLEKTKTSCYNQRDETVAQTGSSEILKPTTSKILKLKATPLYNMQHKLKRHCYLRRSIGGFLLEVMIAMSLVATVFLTLPGLLGTLHYSSNKKNEDQVVYRAVDQYLNTTVSREIQEGTNFATAPPIEETIPVFMGSAEASQRLDVHVSTTGEEVLNDDGDRMGQFVTINYWWKRADLDDEASGSTRGRTDGQISRFYSI